MSFFLYFIGSDFDFFCLLFFNRELVARVILETLRSIPYPDTHHDLSRVLTIISRLGEDPGEEEFVCFIHFKPAVLGGNVLKLEKTWKRRVGRLLYWCGKIRAEVRKLPANPTPEEVVHWKKKKKGTTQLWAWPVSGQLTSDWFWELIKAASGSLSNLSLRLSPQI